MCAWSPLRGQTCNGVDGRGALELLLPILPAPPLSSAWRVHLMLPECPSPATTSIAQAKPLANNSKHTEEEDGVTQRARMVAVSPTACIVMF